MLIITCKAIKRITSGMDNTLLLYEDLFKLSQDLIVIANEDGYFKKVNPQWTKTLGYSEEELLSTPYIKFIHPEDRGKNVNMTLQQVDGVKISQFENRYIGKQGQVIWLEWKCSAVDTTGDIFAIARDITNEQNQQNRLESLTEVLQVKNKQLEDLFNLSQDLIVIANTDGYFKVLNPQWEKVLGYSTKTLRSKPFNEFIHPEDIEKTNREIKKLSEGATTISFENRFTKNTGEHVWLEWNATPVKETGNLFAIARDKTLARKQEEKQQLMLTELKTKNKQLENYAYIASHNLRSPVANIFTLANFLKETKLEKEQQEYADLIQNCAQTLTKTMEDLISAVQVNQSTNLKIKHVSFEKTCEKVLKQLSGELLSSNALVNTNFKEIRCIEYSETYMHSIFLNLISNAIKYRSSKRPPLINIESRRSQDSIQLIFKDNGSGIDLERHKNKIFGFRKTFHNNNDARGFGLFMTKSQVEALNGKISVDSEPEKGTTFTIDIAS